MRENRKTESLNKNLKRERNKGRKQERMEMITVIKMKMGNPENMKKKVIT